MWRNTHFTNGEAISHKFTLLLDPPKKLPQGWAKKRKKLEQFPSEGGGGHMSQFFLRLHISGLTPSVKLEQAKIEKETFYHFF